MKSSSKNILSEAFTKKSLFSFPFNDNFWVEASVDIVESMHGAKANHEVRGASEELMEVVHTLCPLNCLVASDIFKIVETKTLQIAVKWKIDYPWRKILCYQ